MCAKIPTLCREDYFYGGGGGLMRLYGGNDDFRGGNVVALRLFKGKCKIFQKKVQKNLEVKKKCVPLQPV